MEMVVPDDIIEFKNEFDKYKKKLYVVGGAVRDHIMGKEPHDFDLVTDAKPEEIIKILKKFRTDEQGKQFGVVRVFTKNEPEGYEIATFRKDISKGRDTKSDGKKVDFGDHITIEHDVHRRDLTINALFYDLDTEEVVDLVGGLNDIKLNKIKAVGDPSTRFDEDRLRILRSFRFASRNLSDIDTKISKALTKDNRLRGVSDKDDVSQERIIDEFFKAVKWAEKHDKIESLNFYISKLEEYDMLNEMFPGVDISPIFIKTFKLPIIFFILFYKNENLVKLRKKMKEFKIPNSIVDETIFLIKLNKLFNRINIPYSNLDYVPLLQKERKRIGISNETINELKKIIFNNKYLDAFIIFNPKISGKELIKLGFKGTEIGKEIRRREVEEFKDTLDFIENSKNFNL